MRVVGGGTGRRYWYLDFALCDVERGLAQIVDFLSKAEVSDRSWILFFDDDLESEWLGVWDDSPVPPGFE